jgi:hypothetical protein
MDFVCHTDWERLPAGTDALFDRGERTSLFLSRRWFDTLVRHALDADQRPLLACVEERGEILAALPLRSDGTGGWHALSTFYSSLYSVLAPDIGRPGVMDCLAEGLGGLAFQSLRLEPVAEDDPAIRQLRQAMEDRGFGSQRLSYFVNWSHPLHGESFRQYLAQRPSRLRHTIERKGRKLYRESDSRIRLYTDVDLDRAWRDYSAVYRASWKDGERFTGFVPALVRTAAAAGWLRLAILYIDGQPAAAQIWFVVRGKASIFRLVYDERWRRYSPGSLLTSHLMEQVIDRDRVASIDFLTGNEAYKQDWMSERRERCRLVFVRNPSSKATPWPLSRLSKWMP